MVLKWNRLVQAPEMLNKGLLSAGLVHNVQYRPLYREAAGDIATPRINDPQQMRTLAGHQSERKELVKC